MVAVLHLAVPVGARQEAQAPHLPGRFGQRDPGGHLFQRFEAEIGPVLVPGHEGPAAAFLDPDGRMEHQDVGADKGFHHVQQPRMAHELRRPGEQQVGLGPARRLAPGRFRPRLDAGPFAGLAVASRLAGRQQRPGMEEAIVAVLVEVALGDHGCSLSLIRMPFPAQRRMGSRRQRFPVRPPRRLFRAGSGRRARPTGPRPKCPHRALPNECRRR